MRGTEFVRPGRSWPAFGRALTGLALVALAGCSQLRPGGDIDPTAAARDALAQPSPTREMGAPVALREGALTGGGDAARPQIRGFVRRARADDDGLGDLIVRPSGAGAAAGAGPQDEISLDFVGAELASVVQVLMEDGLGANYILDPGVSGTVTLKTTRPLSPAEILPTLEEILRLNEAALIERDGVFRVVPRAEAGLSAPVVTARQIDARGLTLRVTPLRYVRVDDVTEVLDGFAPVAGSIRYNRRSNLVFSLASAAEQSTILDVLSAIDSDYFARRAFALKPLHNADPQTVVDELAQMFATPGGADNPNIRFIAIERMRAVMVVADKPALLNEAVDLLKGLDQGVAAAPRLHVFAIQNRRASELSAILGDIFGAQTTQRGPEQSAVAPGLTPVAAGAAAGGAQTAALNTGVDADGTGAGGALGGGLGTTSLTGAAAAPGGGLAAAAPFASSNTSASRAPSPPGAAAAGDGNGGSDAARAGGVLRIVADESSNAIIALATAEGAEAVRDALRRLDVQPLQVMIEAILVEVALTDALEYGIRWFFETGNFSFLFGDVSAAGQALTGATDILPGFNAAFRTSDASATISALDSVTDVKILSSPTLMVLDGQVARLQVGDQVPITTRSSVSTADPDAPLVTEEEFRDTGVILEIRPTVNSGGLVVLEVRQEVSDVVTTAGAVNPTFSQRVVQSTIAVQSGETIALAGLIEEDAELSREGVPLLSRIPVVGSAFGATVESAERSELLVLIRPMVVRDPGEARAATEELSRKLSALTGGGGDRSRGEEQSGGGAPAAPTAVNASGGR